MKFNDNKKLSDFLTTEPKKLKIPQVKKIIAVASAKGGVGKSTIAANLSIAIANKGKNVALVDADIYGPSIPYLMNISNKPKIIDNLFIPIIAHNIKCMSIGMILENGKAGVWRGPMINKILNQLIRTVNWGFDDKTIDYMVIDMPPGTGDIYLSLIQNFKLDGIVIISTPQNLAIIDAERSIDCFRKLDVNIFGIIENMSYFVSNNEKIHLFGQDGVKKLAQKENINLLGELPLLKEISELSNNHQLIMNCDTENEFNQNLHNIATKIIKA